MPWNAYSGTERHTPVPNPTPALKVTQGLSPPPRGGAGKDELPQLRAKGLHWGLLSILFGPRKGSGKKTSLKLLINSSGQ